MLLLAIYFKNIPPQNTIARIPNSQSHVLCEDGKSLPEVSLTLQQSTELHVIHLTAEMAG